MKSDKLVHFGYWIRHQRSALGLSRPKFLARGKNPDGDSLTDKRLWEIESKPAAEGLQDGTYGVLARALGISLDELKTRWQHEPVTPPDEVPTPDKPLSAEDFLKAKGLPIGTLAREKAERDAKPYVPAKPEHIAPAPTPHRVPLYGQVSATLGRDLTSGTAPETIETMVQGRSVFAMRLAGACMEPACEDGDIAFFDRARWDAEGFVDGKDYLVVLDNGDATFKRVFRESNGTHVRLVPLNDGTHGRTQAVDKYKSFKLRRDKIVWAARLVGVQKG